MRGTDDRCGHADHLGALAKSLRLFGLDPDLLRIERKLVFADAAEKLSCFMCDGSPDERLFNETLDVLMGAVNVAPGKPVKIFGEMVALLWEEGNHDATFMLEDMWNRACREKDLHLFCGYPGSLFTDSLHGKLVHVCQHHATAISGVSATFIELKYRPI